jgi:polyvinyl alcohol dehydrogenase (cytochrome)
VRVLPLLSLALLAPFLAPLASAAEAPDWPAAHGVLENHRSVPSALTPESVLAVERVWRYKALGAVTGTPVHEDGVAYFADWAGGVHAVRISDGTAVWSVKNDAGVDSSLAVDGPRVLVGDMDGNLTARDRQTGKVLWRTWVEPLAGTHLFGSPVPHGGRIYQGIASEQTDLAYQGPQDFRGGVAALDSETGKVLWKTYMQPQGAFGISVWSTPALDPGMGLLFVGTGNAYGPPAGTRSDSVVALRMDDGRIVWHHQATEGDTFNARGSPGADADFGSSPILFEAHGRKLVGDGDKAGRFYVLDRATGELVWNRKVDFVAQGASLAEKEGFLGTGAFANGVIFAPTTARSMVHALDAATGEVKWARELNEQPKDYGARMFGSTTVSGGVVLQGNAFGKLFALDAATGKVLKEIDVGGDVQGGVSLAGNVILVPDAGGVMWEGSGNLTAYRVAGEAGSAPPTPATPGRPPTGSAATPTPAGTPGGADPGVVPDVVVTAPPGGAGAAESPLESSVPGVSAWAVLTAAASAAVAAGRGWGRRRG